jgi:hypothetical protein
VYAGVQEKINETTGLKKKLMLDAIKVGREHNLEYVYKGLTPPPVLHMKYKFYEKTIYSLLKKTIGIENGRFFPTAGAAIPPAVQEFVLSVGINMVAGYGGFIKNYYTAIDIPLVNVQMGLVENDYLVKNILTCIVGLPELSIVRIGTIWKNQVRQDSYWNKYALYEEQIPLSFNLEKIPAKCIIYKKNDSDKKNLQECNIEDLHSKNSLEFDYDEKIENLLAKGNNELVSFVHDLRKQAESKGIRATFSYRCISMVTKLEGKLVIEDIMAMVIFKGMDKDTINTFRANGYDKYAQAMRNIQK